MWEVIAEAVGEVIGEAVSLMVDLMFPRRCPVCDKPVKPLRLIHPECEATLHPIVKNYCMKCGREVSSGEKEYCYDCAGKARRFERGRVAFTYDEICKSVYRFKYSGRQEYAEYYGRVIAENYGDEFKEWGVEALVPVPIHRNRMKKRGYNQAEVLAGAISKHTGIPLKKKLIVREKDTKPLKLLNPEERQNNLKKAFKLAENDVKLKKIMVVDDIYTTGSTIDTVAQELQENGVRSVYFVTLTAGNGL